MAITTFVDIGSSTLKIIEVEEGKKPVILSHHILEIDSKSTKHEPSEPKNVSIKKKLTACFKAHSIASKKIILIVKGQKIFSRSYILPEMSWKSIFDAVKGKILEDSGLKESDLKIYINPLKIPPYIYRGEVVAKSAAISKDFVGEYSGFFSDFPGVQLSLCPLEDCLSGMLRLMPEAGSDEVDVCIHMSSTTTTVLLTRYGIPLLSHHIPTGGTNFTRVLMGDIVFDGVTVTTTQKEAEEIKERHGILRENESLEEKCLVKLPSDVISSLLSPLLESFVAEIRRFLTFAKNELSIERIERIYLTGVGAGLRNLDFFLERYFSIPVSYVRVGDFLEYGKEASKEFMDKNGDILAHLVGGACMEDRTDFLKKESKWRIFKQNLDKYYVLILFCLLIVCYGLLEVYNQNFKKQSIAAENQWSDKLVRYSLYFQTQNDKKVCLNALSSVIRYNNQRIPWTGFYKTLSKSVPEGMKLSKLDISSVREESLLLEADYICSLEGWVSASGGQSAEMILSDFIGRINATPWIKSTEIVSVAKDPEMSQEMKKFNLKCKFEFRS